MRIKTEIAKIRWYLLLVLFLFVFIFPFCGGGKQGPSGGQELNAQLAVTEFDGESGLLLKYLQDQGDYVNSRQFPSMIKAATVYEELDGNNYVIDLRLPEYYEMGHIQGAVNIRMSDLADHFENDIVPFQYDKIIFVCYRGHISAYVTCLFRLLGYGNVYSMRWGMSSWNMEFAKDRWLKGLTNKYADQLETTTNPKPEPLYQPVLTTGLSTGAEILNHRVRTLLSAEVENVFIDDDPVFKNPEDYFIINFERRDKYESGHIPGAIRYKPQGTLGIVSEMATIPTDRTVVMYCGTGQNSAFGVAYLRMFGYDARSHNTGNNSFMHKKMLEEREALSWQPFTEEFVNDFPYVTGK
ncbi:MAG: hypothetical protein ISS19_18480 [Bacteroidales bacterium]|nr:hypothetical protein [Bacteroidales bacterium]